MIDKRKFYSLFYIVILFLIYLPDTWASVDRRSARLSVLILDSETGEPTPVRIKLMDSRGFVAPLPDEAIGIMYGRDDKAEGYAYQPDSSFYVDGSFSLDLDPGLYSMEVSKGFEYVKQTKEIDLTERKEMVEEITLQRWINMPGKGWYSADDHIHIRRSPRENPLIMKWIRAEDIHVGALLQMGDFWATYYSQFAFGEEGVYQQNDHMLTSGQEDPRTHEIGHTILLAHDSAVRHRHDYYSYDRVFDRVHELDGLTGYAHQGMSFHGYRGMTMDVLQKKIDFLELLQFCVPEGPLHLDHYYHFLDLGYKLTATAGSDFPWCGRSSGWDARIGNARFYTYLGDEVSFESWKTNLKAGHTYVSSGPMLELKVNGAIPGDELNLDRGESVYVEATAYGQQDMVPLEALEIIAHGQVIGEQNSGSRDQSTEQITIELELPVSEGIWIAARCRAGDQQVAHTTPVYVIVEKGHFINEKTAPHYLDLNEKYLQEIEAEIEERDDRINYHAWRYEDKLRDRIDETRNIIGEIRNKVKE